MITLLDEVRPHRSVSVFHGPISVFRVGRAQ